MGMNRPRLTSRSIIAFGILAGCIAYFVCCLRTLFPWFCNANGPKGRVLWGNAT